MVNEEKTFGEVFSELLSEEGLSRTGIGKEMGVTRVTIHKLLSDTHAPSLDRALLILSRFGRTLAVVKEDEALPDSAVLLKRGKEQDGRIKLNFDE